MACGCGCNGRGKCGGQVRPLGLGATASAYETFDLDKYKSIWAPVVPEPQAVDPQWGVLNRIMSSTDVVPGSPAERMGFGAAADAVKRAADGPLGLSTQTWLFIGAGVLGIALVTRGRSR